MDVQQVFYRMEENVSGCYAQKPLKSIDRIIRASSDPGDTIVDFFSHSGTTLLSAEINGRRCVTMDIDPCSGGKTAEIGDGEGAALHFVGLELAGARAGGEVDDGALQTGHVLLVGTADHGDDQAVFQRHRDANVDFVMVDDIVAVERCVEQREVAQRHRRGARDERQVGEREAIGWPGTPPYSFRAAWLLWSYRRGGRW